MIRVATASYALRRILYGDPKAGFRGIGGVVRHKDWSCRGVDCLIRSGRFMYRDLPNAARVFVEEFGVQPPPTAASDLALLDKWQKWALDNKDRVGRPYDNTGYIGRGMGVRTAEALAEDYQRKMAEAEAAEAEVERLRQEAAVEGP